MSRAEVTTSMDNSGSAVLEEANATCTHTNCSTSFETDRACTCAAAAAPDAFSEHPSAKAPIRRNCWPSCKFLPRVDMPRSSSFKVRFRWLQVSSPQSGSSKTNHMVRCGRFSRTHLHSISRMATPGKGSSRCTVHPPQGTEGLASSQRLQRRTSRERVSDAVRMRMRADGGERRARSTVFKSNLADSSKKGKWQAQEAVRRS